MIYFIHAENGLVKIGHARDPYRRLEELRTGCPVDIEIIRILDGGQKIEAWLHRKFAARRVRGEWFEYSSEMLTIVPPDEVPQRRKPAETRKPIGDHIREAHRLGLLSERMQKEYAPFLGGTA